MVNDLMTFLVAPKFEWSRMHACFQPHGGFRQSMEATQRLRL